MSTRTLRAALHLLDDRVDSEVIALHDGEPMRITQGLLAFFHAAVERINMHPDMQVTAVAPDEIPTGSLSEVEVYLCARATFSGLFDQDEGTLGVHIVTTPVADPFSDGEGEARAWRVVIPFEVAAVYWLITDAVSDFDGRVEEAELVASAMAWLLTITHEIHHVLWFAGNGSFNSPADLSDMETEIGRDIFDITTGYGLRPAIIDGEEVEPEDAEHARDLLEEMIEERGRAMAEDIFQGDLAPERFLDLLRAALGVELDPATDLEFST